MIRKSKDRGYFDFGWLKTFHSFSFSGYYDPNFMGYRSLRVINEDEVAAGEGFPRHPHKDMEILTYVYEGTVAHRDSMGNETEIRAGEFQIMSAGTGITHSEFNPSQDEKLKLIQIWIKPKELGITPRYDQKHFSREQLAGGLKLIVSPDSREGSMLVNQDAFVYTGILAAGTKYERQLSPERKHWLQVVEGEVEANGTKLSAGDGLTIESASQLKLVAGKSEANLILFDLA
jgi:redox-sensitive bicupin YhaK (pirin superfamily)